jgi:hypothetical protein
MAGPQSPTFVYAPHTRLVSTSMSDQYTAFESRDVSIFKCSHCRSQKNGVLFSIIANCSLTIVNFVYLNDFMINRLHGKVLKHGIRKKKSLQTYFQKKQECLIEEQLHDNINGLSGIACELSQRQHSECDIRHTILMFPDSSFSSLSVGSVPDPVP